MFNTAKNNSNLFTMVLSVLSVFFIFQYRYRIINLIIKNRWIRRLAVSGALQIPFIRDRLYNRFMPF